MELISEFGGGSGSSPKKNSKTSEPPKPGQIWVQTFFYNRIIPGVGKLPAGSERKFYVLEIIDLGGAVKGFFQDNVKEHTVIEMAHMTGKISQYDNSWRKFRDS